MGRCSYLTIKIQGKVKYNTLSKQAKFTYSKKKIKNQTHPQK
jgi:hypothetical protein